VFRSEWGTNNGGKTGGKGGIEPATEGRARSEMRGKESEFRAVQSGEDCASVGRRRGRDEGGSNSVPGVKGKGEKKGSLSFGVGRKRKEPRGSPVWAEKGEMRRGTLNGKKKKTGREKSHNDRLREKVKREGTNSIRRKRRLKRLIRFFSKGGERNGDAMIKRGGREERVAPSGYAGKEKSWEFRTRKVHKEESNCWRKA